MDLIDFDQLAECFFKDTDIKDTDIKDNIKTMKADKLEKTMKIIDEELVYRYKCKDCNGTLSFLKGVESCEDCGIIYGCTLDYGAEWRNDIEKGDEKNRCGMPINNMLLVSSYSTGIAMGGFSNKKIYNDIKRSIIWNSKPYAERALEERFSNIQFKCKRHAISDAIIEYAQTIYYDVIKELAETEACKTKRGNNNEGLQAAAVYQAFQDDGRPKTYKEIATIFGIDPMYVSSGIKLFRDLMKKTIKCNYAIKSSSYLDYITKYSDILKLSTILRDEIIIIANRANDLKILDNNTPVAIVAGCIYYVIIINGISHISKLSIEAACGVSIPTISKVSDKLLSHNKELNI